VADVLPLALLVVSIGLVDSLNPGTVGPALYLAAGARPARRTLGFATGVVAVNLLGGIALLAGPGRIALDALPRAGARTQHLAELAVAAVLLVAAAFAWRARHRIRDRYARPSAGSSRAPLLLGATIALVELPTALPYFAVIAAVSASQSSVAVEIAMLALFNLAFVAPVLAIAALAGISHGAVEQHLDRLRHALLAHVGEVLASLLIAIAVALALVGVLGLTG
jgi:cytochrome c biogenesis protein CcdA